MFSMYTAPSDRDYYGEWEPEGCRACGEDECICPEIAADWASLFETEASL